MSFLTLNPNQSTYTPGGSLEGQVFQPTYEPAPTLQLSYVPSPSYAPQTTYVPQTSYAPSAPVQLAGASIVGSPSQPAVSQFTPAAGTLGQQLWMSPAYGTRQYYDSLPSIFDQQPNYRDQPWYSPRPEPTISPYDTGAFADIGKPGTTESAATAYRLEPGQVVSPLPGEVKPTAPVAVVGAGGAFPSNALPGSPVAGQPPAASAQAGPTAVVETGGSWGG